MFPISEHAEPPKLTSLNIDVFAGVRLGSFAHLERRKSFGFFNDLELDRQSMTIPTGDVGCSETGHRPALHDQVLQYLVERRAHVDVAIGKRGTIVQNEKRIVFSRFLNLLVDFLSVPAGQNFRFPTGQVGLHRELRLRQIQCLFVVHSKDTETSIKWRDRKEAGGRRQELQDESGVQEAGVQEFRSGRMRDVA